MRRWHAERALMWRRWQEEKRIHERFEDANRPSAGEPCHCLRGMGTMRKIKPHDCGQTRCQACHTGKWDRRRHNERRAAIEMELAAEVDGR